MKSKTSLGVLSFLVMVAILVGSLSGETVRANNNEYPVPMIYLPLVGNPYPDLAYPEPATQTPQPTQPPQPTATETSTPEPAEIEILRIWTSGSDYQLKDNFTRGESILLYVDYLVFNGPITVTLSWSLIGPCGQVMEYHQTFNFDGIGEMYLHEEIPVNSCVGDFIYRMTINGSDIFDRGFLVLE